MSAVTENAKIGATRLGPGGHGIFSAYIELEYDGGGQVFGGIALDQHNGERNANSRRAGTAYGMEFIVRLMEAVGVETWEELSGKFVRVEHTHDGVTGIGHIVKDQWFRPADIKHIAT